MEAQENLNLYHLFSKEQLFEDTNGDGYPDKLRLRLEIAAGLKDSAVWAGLLNLSARINQQVMSIDSPLIKKADSARRSLDPTLSVALTGKAICFSAGIRRFTRNHLYIEGSCGQAIGRLLNSLALSDEKEIAPLPDQWEVIQISSDGKAVDVQNQKKGKLTTLPIYAPAAKPSDRHHLEPEEINDLIDFPNAIYGFNDLKDPRSKLLKWNIELASTTLSAEAGISLADFLALCVLESTDITLPIAFARDVKEISGTLQIFQNEPGTNRPEQARIQLHEGRIVVSGDGRGLSKTFRHWAAMVAASLKREPEKEDAFSRKLKTIQNLISGRAPLGRWGREIIHAAESGTPLPPCEARSKKRIESACRLLEIPHPPLKAKAPRLRRRTSWPDEVGRIDKYIEEIPEGIGLLEGHIFISRSLTIRLECQKRWESMLIQKGYTPRLQVLNTYKPGFSWLTEAVLPALSSIQHQVDTACLSFQSYTPAHSDHSTALEMESRWLQEAFPGPDCIARTFGWPPERIRFRCDPQLTEAYRFQALDKTGRSLFDVGFTPFESCMAFIGHLKENSCVHPTASGIRLRQNGLLLYERVIASDREHFWHILQNRWLPEMDAGMTARLHQVVKNDRPVFWEEVRVEVAIDESDERLPIGQERICPMEALHEDIYFGLLDFFSAFCSAHGITDQAHFGRILPVVSAVSKNGKPAASLTARPGSVFDSETIRPMPTPQVIAMSFPKSRCLVSLTDTAEDLTFDQKRVFSRIAEAWNIRLSFDGRLFQADLPLPGKSRRDSQVHFETNHPPPMDRTIGLAETDAWVAGFEEFPHLKVTCGGTSVQGRSIPVVEAFLQGPGIHTSIAKARSLKPTLLLIARHHANEISSTNAALSLCWRMSRTRPGRKLLERVNLACIPMENPDGVATYEALLPECEDHILHAARYNALGVEWYGDYLSDSPRFPEAAVKTRLWHRWLPEYVLDAHGVPNHEWVQPFGGYLNHRFREYWIPRAFVFVILPFIDDPEHPEHENAKNLAKSFEDHLSTESDIQELNRSLRDRYARYARRFAPEVFPESMTEHLEIVPPGARIRRTNFGYRARPVTRNEIVSEVVDEGATGEWLEKCVRAHLKIADSLLSALADHPQSRLVTVRRSDGFLSVGWRKSDSPEPAIKPVQT